MEQTIKLESSKIIPNKPNRKITNVQLQTPNQMIYI